MVPSIEEARAMTDIMVSCPSCSASNRIPTDRIGPGRKAVCGRCKTDLPTDTSPLVVTDATFGAEVERAPLPVLLDLWAPWCGPCRMIAPALDALAVEMAGRARIAKMNVDDNPATSSRFGVRSIPTLLLFKDGREVDRIVGVQSKAALAARLQPFLSPRPDSARA
jgi:thioredoxin 2